MGTYFRFSKPLLKYVDDRPRLSTGGIKKPLANEDLATRILYVLSSGKELMLDILYPRVVENPNRHKQNYLMRKLGHMVDKDLLKIKANSVVITNKGRDRLREHSIRKPIVRKWDGKWRFVIFDIWESRRKVRNQLRRELVTYGFFRVQNSVWAFPHDCEEFISLLKTDMRIGRGLLFLVVDRLEDDYVLRNRFKV